MERLPTISLRWSAPAFVARWRAIPAELRENVLSEFSSMNEIERAAVDVLDFVADPGTSSLGEQAADDVAWLRAAVDRLQRPAGSLPAAPSSQDERLLDIRRRWKAAEVIEFWRALPEKRRHNTVVTLPFEQLRQPEVRELLPIAIDVLSAMGVDGTLGLWRAVTQDVMWLLNELDRLQMQRRPGLF